VARDYTLPCLLKLLNKGSQFLGFLLISKCIYHIFWHFNNFFSKIIIIDFQELFNVKPNPRLRYLHGVQNTHWIFLLFLHNGHINLYVLHASKHFNMVNASIAFLNGDSFKGASTNRQFFWQALCACIAFKNIYL